MNSDKLSAIVIIGGLLLACSFLVGAIAGEKADTINL